MTGQTLGHYKILELLGKGGMGEVYRAEDTTLKRQVALKVLPSALATDREHLERFQREAEALAALDHPNIVTIHSVEEAKGVRFLTMQLVEGEPLSRPITKGGLPLEQIFEIAIPLADALATAHERGIIHRDLKPSNAMVTSEGRVKVLDFGLAKLTAAPAAPGATSGEEDKTLTAPLTREGTVLGPTPYMSPEQLRGQEVDARSDVFALGIVLYEMATGNRPFQGAAVIDLASNILTAQPRSLEEVRPELPRQVGRIIESCLAKSPSERFQTARDVHNQLRALQTETATGVQLGPRRQTARLWASPRVWIAAVLAVTALGAGTYYLASSRLGKEAPSAATDMNRLKLKDYEASAAALMENFGDPEALQMSIEAWTKVLELDPDYAPALAGMANARTLIAWNSIRTRPNVFYLVESRTTTSASTTPR